EPILQEFFRSREQLDRDAATEQPAAVGEREVLFPALVDPPREQPQTFQPAERRLIDHAVGLAQVERLIESQPEHQPLAQANIPLPPLAPPRGPPSGPAPPPSGGPRGKGSSSPSPSISRSRRRTSASSSSTSRGGTLRASSASRYVGSRGVFRRRRPATVETAPIRRPTTPRPTP